MAGKALDRTTDRAFTRLFTAYIDWPGATEADFLHRIIRVDGGRLPAGIRFYDQYTTRPFVDLLAYDLPAAPDWHVLSDAVAQEWRIFRPQALLLLLPEAAAMPPGCQLDMTVHAARYLDMPAPALKPNLALKPFVDPTEAAQLLSLRYQDLATEAPRARTPAYGV